MAIHSVVLEQAFGANSEGDVVQCNDELAEKLVAAGIAREATDEDLGGDDEGAEDVTPEGDAPELVEEQVSRVARSVESTLTKATEKAVEKLSKGVKRPAFAGVHASGSDEAVTGGFKDLGDFCLTSVAKSMGDQDAARKVDRFKALAHKNMIRKGQMTTTASAGGDLVPEEWAKDLWKLSFEKVPDLLGMCNQYPMQNKIMNIPAWVQSSGTAGITSSVIAEADTITDTTGVTANVQLDLQKFAALVNVSDELERFNSYALDAVLKQVVPQRIRYLVNDSIVNGSNSQVNLVGNAATVVIGRATSSVISYADILKMDAALYDDFADDAVWLVNPSALPSLYSVRFPDNSGSYPAFAPGTFGSQNLLGPKPVFELLGKPVYRLENVPALGSKGDLILYSPKSIAAGSSGLIADATPFLYFNKAINTYRFMWYADTVNPLTTFYTRKDGSKASNIVVLNSTSSSN